MSDNLRRYRAIREALKQCYPGEPRGRMAHHLSTLAAFINGIVGSKSSQLPSIATKSPDRAKPDSRVKRLSRWLDNEHILEEVYFLPYADVLLTHLALETVVLVMDGSGVGRGCSALMIHVIYQGRALPLAALCDHPVTLTGALFSEDTHLMSEALRKLGFAVTENVSDQTIRVEGRGGDFPVTSAELFVGLAGTAARFLPH